MKKFFIIFMVIIIVITSVEVPVYASVDNLILDNSYNRYIIGSLLIASGMVYNSTEKLNNAVTEYIDNWNDHESGWRMPNGGGGGTWQEIIDGITVGSKVVYDINTGKLKQVINMSSDLIDYVQEWVNMKYQQFENYLTKPNYWILSESNTYYFPEENNNYYLYFINSDSTYSIIGTAWRYTKQNDGSYLYPNWLMYPMASPLTITITYNTSNENTYYYVKELSGTNKLLNYKSTFQHVIVSTSPITTGVINPTLPESTNSDISIAYGNPNAVDNPNYNYTHNQTGIPTITVPLKTDETGLPQTDTDGYFVPDTNDDDLVGIGISDISTSDISGIEVTSDVTVPVGTGTQYPDMSIPDTATETDFDNTNKRAFYQTKFPFCLPWDIKAVFMLLNAPAKAPKWDIDIITPSLRSKIGITGTTKFTFDMGEFEIIGKVSRFFSFIGFILTLILFTRNIIKS